METTIQTPPKNNEIEVSIIGNGYGECVLLHVGNKEWIVIDSCKVREKNYGKTESAAINYLSQISVNIKQDVKLVVATHWHDDHIKKISEVFESCESADFGIAGITSREVFLKLALLSPITNNIKQGDSNTGFSEFYKVRETIQKRNKNFKFVIQDRKIWGNSDNVEIFSLSPHDKEIEQSLDSIKSLIPNGGEVARIPFPTPNNSSIVLLVKIGNDSILLGGDLEKKGWVLMEQDSICLKKSKSNLFKIPHHGSLGAYYDKIWDNHLMEFPHCLLTPFKKGNIELPTKEGIKKLQEKTNNLFITTLPDKTQKKAKTNHGFLQKTYTKKKVKHIPYDFNMVRLRKNVAKNNSDWRVECFGNAENISNVSENASS